MTRDEILEHVRRSLIELFELEPDDVRPEANLYEDLDLDSIDAVDMAVQIQELTGRRVEEKALREARTVNDLVSLVERMQAGKA